MGPGRGDKRCGPRRVTRGLTRASGLAQSTIQYEKRESDGVRGQNPLKDFLPTPFTHPGNDHLNIKIHLF